MNKTVVEIPVPDEAERLAAYVKVLRELKVRGVQYGAYAAMVGLRGECISRRVRGHAGVSQEAYLALLFIHHKVTQSLGA